MHNKCSDEMNSSLQNNEFILMKNFNFLFLFIGNISRPHHGGIVAVIANQLPAIAFSNDFSAFSWKTTPSIEAKFQLYQYKPYLLSDFWSGLAIP